MNCNRLPHSIKAHRVPIQPSHTQPGAITAQMEKQFREEETKVLCIAHLSTFAITMLPLWTLRKIVRPHKLGYSDI